MISVALVFLLVLYVLNYYPRKRILIICLLLSSSIVFDIAKSSWTGSSTGFGADISVGKRGLGISQFDDRFRTLASNCSNFLRWSICEYCNTRTSDILAS